MLRFLPFLAALLLPGALAAHDFYLVPATFTPAPGAEVAVRLEVGDHFESEGDRPFQKDATPLCVWFGRRAVEDLRLAAVEGARPFARVKFPAAGAYWLVVDRAPRLITLKADRFDAYLREEGLEAVRALRRKLGEDKKPGRERYSRSLKALFQVGGKSGDTWKLIPRQRLQIAPLVDPHTLRPGGKLPVRVLFEGKPLASVRVTAYRREGGKTITRHAITSPTGEATFTLDAAGMWLLRLVHMRRAEGDREADWHSDWTALSFAVKAP